MEAARTVLRPLASAALHATSTTPTSSSLMASLQFLSLSSSSRRAFSTTSTCLKASTRRTKKALNVAPHPSFLASLTESQDHIIFNPPASAPSVYNTPYKFLPKSDPRRRSTLPSRLFHDKSSPISSLPFSSSPSSSVPLPPPATALDKMVSKYHLGPEDVEEMRRLRNSDPVKWHVKKLAKKYECSTFFVMACTRASEEHQKRLRERQEKIKARWGPIRTKAREEREKRKKMLLQGLL